MDVKRVASETPRGVDESCDFELVKESKDKTVRLNKTDHEPFRGI